MTLNQVRWAALLILGSVLCYIIIEISNLAILNHSTWSIAKGQPALNKFG